MYSSFLYSSFYFLGPSWRGVSSLTSSSPALGSIPSSSTLLKSRSWAYAVSLFSSLVVLALSARFLKVDICYTIIFHLFFIFYLFGSESTLALFWDLALSLVCVLRLLPWRDHLPCCMGLGPRSLVEEHPVCSSRDRAPAGKCHGLPSSHPSWCQSGLLLHHPQWHN